MDNKRNIFVLNQIFFKNNTAIKRAKFKMILN